MDKELKDLAVALYDIDAVKFGEFVTKIGLKTPIYFDLRVIIAHPKIMLRLAKALWHFSKDLTNTSQICGVPYTALPLATLISVDSNVPMLIKRKEAKEYGTKKMIEGNFTEGDHCIIIEDVVTSGSSILETVESLKKEGLKITKAFVVIDREQGGRENLENNGIQMKSLFTVTQLMENLLAAGKVTSDTVRDVGEYLKSIKAPLKCVPDHKSFSPVGRMKARYSLRAKQAKNPIASKLLELMESKQSTLCLAVDKTKTESILEYADVCGPHIAVLKIHVDIIEDFTDNFVKRLKDLAKKHKFFIMEDRKFGDIGNTVALQYQRGIYKIAEWADFVTVHPVAGATIIDGLKDGLNGITEPRGIFLVVEMSTKNALTKGDYVQSALSIAKDSDMVVGLVCQSNIISDLGLVQLTPGVKLSESSDNLGQQYNTPMSVVNAGADLAVVGRGITEAPDKLKATLKYKEELWSAYEQRISG